MLSISPFLLRYLRHRRHLIPDNKDQDFSIDIVPDYAQDAVRA